MQGCPYKRCAISYVSGHKDIWREKMELELIKLELKFATKHLIHKLIYHLIFLIQNFAFMTILLGL